MPSPHHPPAPQLRRRRRAGSPARAALALAVLGAGLVGTGLVDVGHASAGAPVGPLRDGVWNGSMAVGIGFTLSPSGAQVSGKASGNGTFHLTLTGGTAGGDYVLGASSSAKIDAPNVQGQADGVWAIMGEMQGTGAAPIFSPTQAHVDVTGKVTVNGFEVPIDQGIDLGADSLVSSTMAVTRSSCTLASGTWGQEFKSGIQAAGGSVTTLQGSWAATWSKAPAGAQDAALQDLLGRGEAVLAQWFADGTFDAAALSQLLIDAEHYAASLPKDSACGAKVDAWASPLSGLVERLLTALANSTSTTAEDLWFGALAGLRTGNLPAGDALDANLQAKAEDLLLKAVDAGDKAGVTMIGMAADSLGWAEIADGATTALGSMT